MSSLAIPCVVAFIILSSLTQANAEVNLALGRPAWQSSVQGGGVPGKAVDGNTDGAWSQNTCTQTNMTDPDPWWAVDLGGTYELSSIVIYNRGDCCVERLKGISVAVTNDNEMLIEGDADLNEYAQCGGLVTQTRTNIIECAAGSVGRYVYIYYPQVPKDAVLNLCEVEIYGYKVSTQENALDEIISDNPRVIVGDRFTQHKDAHISYGIPQDKSVITVAECAILCLADSECKGFDFNYGYIEDKHVGPYHGVACWFHNSSKSLEKIVKPYMLVNTFWLK